jgi:hypothetical protein
MPGKQYALATITTFVFYDLLNLMLLFFGAGRLLLVLHFLPYTVNCSDALAMMLPVYR